MNNKYALKKYSALLILFFLIFSLSFFVYSSRAEDDDREDNDRYEENKYNDDIPQNAIPAVVTPKIISQPASFNITTMAPSNNVDLSNFKDSDQDGIPDVSDKYPGEDDFSYFLIDSNNNGIADDLENLIK